MKFYLFMASWHQIKLWKFIPLVVLMGVLALKNANKANSATWRLKELKQRQKREFSNINEEFQVWNIHIPHFEIRIKIFNFENIN